MKLSDSNIQFIKGIIIDSLRKKLKSYRPESKSMPFHYRLLGKDRMALYSFIQSLNTTFGTSIYEPVAVALSKFKFKKATSQYVIGDKISEGAQSEIQDIINKLTIGNIPAKKDELERIRKVSQRGKTQSLKTVKVDLFLESQDGSKYFIDLKTAKPNIAQFKDFKKTLLEWCAIELFKNPDAAVHSFIAIPYNPYEPQPYERWTLKGMLDLDEELKVGAEFWDFLAGTGTYSQLLNCFEQAGIELRPEIDDYFKKFKE